MAYACFFINNPPYCTCGTDIPRLFSVYASSEINKKMQNQPTLVLIILNGSILHLWRHKHTFFIPHIIFSLFQLRFSTLSLRTFFKLQVHQQGSKSSISPQKPRFSDIQSLLTWSTCPIPLGYIACPLSYILLLSTWSWLCPQTTLTHPEPRNMPCHWAFKMLAPSATLFFHYSPPHST